MFEHLQHTTAEHLTAPTPPPDVTSWELPLAQMAQSFSTNADWVLIQCRWFKEGCTSLCNLWTTWQRGMWKLCVCVCVCLERFKGLMPGFSVANLPISIIVKWKQSIACQNRFSSIFPFLKTHYDNTDIVTWSLSTYLQRLIMFTNLAILLSFVSWISLLLMVMRFSSPIQLCLFVVVLHSSPL